MNTVFRADRRDVFARQAVSNVFVGGVLPFLREFLVQREVFVGGLGLFRFVRDGYRGGNLPRNIATCS